MLRPIRYPAAASCVVCNSDRTATVGAGSQTRLIDCPACVGVFPDALTGEEKRDAERMCEAAGVAIRVRALEDES